MRGRCGKSMEELCDRGVDCAENEGDFDCDKIIMLPSEARKESGTCNVCCAPCSSCMHRIATGSESNVKHKCKREEASTCSSDCAKSRSCYDAQCAASEASNLVSASSSQNSYSVSVESHSVIKPFVGDETSEAVDMPFKFSTVKKFGQNQQLGGKSCTPVSELHHSTVVNEQYEECHDDNDSNFLGSGDCGDLIIDSDADLRRNISFSRALKCTSDDKAIKVSQSKGSCDITVRRVVSEKKNLHEKSLDMQSLSKDNEEPMECLVGVVKPSYSGPLIVGGGVKEKSICHNAEIKQTGQNKNNLSSQELKNGSNGFQGAADVDTCSENNDQIEKNSPVLVESNKQVFQIQGQPHSMAEAQASDSDNRLIDVNVCDICGDTGREALLATCSRCTDGAEHIYCMRVKLDKVPDGNWICEQCYLEENIEKKKLYSAVLISNNSERNEKVNLKPESSSRYKGSVKFGAKTANSKTCESLKAKQNSFKLRKHIVPAGMIADVIKEQTEIDNGLMVSPSRAKSSAISHSKSFKHMEMIKQKSASTASSPRVQHSSSFQMLSRTISTGSIPLKAHKDLCSRNVLSKQVSFDISKGRPKEKLLVDGQAQKRIRESTSNSTTKDAPVSSITKSAASKSVNSGSPIAGFVNKAQVLPLELRENSVDKIPPLKSPRLEDQTSIRTPKEKTKIGRQHNTFPAQSAVSLSPMARPLDVKQKTPFDVKVHSKPDPTTLSMSRTLNDAKDFRFEGKKQKPFGTGTSISENRSSNVNPVTAPQCYSKNKIYTNISKSDIEKGLDKTVTKTLNLNGSARIGEKSKSSTAESPKKRTTLCNKEIGIHKGNDASHTLKFCTSQEPTDAVDGTNRSVRLKDAFQAVIKKNKIQKNSRLHEECTMTSNNDASRTTKFYPTQEPTDAAEGTNRGVRLKDAFQAVIKKNKIHKNSRLHEECTITSNNDASHTTKFYPTQKPTDAAEGTKRGGRLRDAFQTVIQNNKMDKNNRLLEQTEEGIVTSNSMTCNVAPESTLNKCQKNLPNKDGFKWQQKFTSVISDSTKTVVDFAMEQSKHSVDASCLSKSANMDATVANPENVISDKLHENLSMQILPSRSPVICSAATAVIPQHDFIWQGIFEILSEGNSLELVDGIQAHLASSVSPKVLEVVRHIPAKIQLEKVPRVTVWPVQFQESSPTEESIALYFFAKDAHSYEKSYLKLLDWILRNDMALRGFVNEVELLIFPSNMLPDNSRHWNTLLFLWGVFRARIESSSRPHSDLHEQLCSSNLSRDLSSSLPCEISIIQKIDSDVDPEKANIKSNKIPDSRPAEENSFEIVKLEKAAHASDIQQWPLCEPPPKFFNSSNLEGLEESSCQGKMKSEGMSVKPEGAVEEPFVQSSHLNSSLLPYLKRSLSCVAATDNKASKRLARSDSWHEKHTCFSVADDKKVIGIKCHDEGHQVDSPCDHAISRNSSAKVFHLFGKVVEQLHTDVHSVNLSSEHPKYTEDLKLLDQGILKNNIENGLGSIHSSEMEVPGAESPDLELSLGAPKRMSKAAIPSLRLPSGAIAIEEENITLSLASPGTESENSRNPNPKTEQLFPEGSFYKTCRAPFRSFAYT